MAKKDICEFCEGEIDYQPIRARFHFQGKTIYVDNVPAGKMTRWLLFLKNI